LTYQVKFVEATEYLRALQSDQPPESAAAWPYVAAEAEASGMTAQACATRIAQTGAYWGAVLGPQIEASRVGGKDALVNLQTIAEVSASVAATVAVLESI
jgi:hypothetical protein